jgi:hypothetical protein
MDCARYVVALVVLVSTEVNNQVFGAFRLIV